MGTPRVDHPTFPVVLAVGGLLFMGFICGFIWAAPARPPVRPAQPAPSLGVQDLEVQHAPALVQRCRDSGGLIVLPFDPGAGGQVSSITAQCARPEALTPLWPLPQK